MIRMATSDRRKGHQEEEVVMVVVVVKGECGGIR